MSSKVDDVVAIKDTKELAKWVKPLYVINDYMKSEDDYRDFQETIYNIIKGCFEHEDCRTYPVKFKFYVTDKKTYTLELRLFLVNVFAWYPFVNLYGIPHVLDESLILQAEQIPDITDFINNKIILVLREYSIRNTVVNTSVAEVLYNLNRISTDFALILNMTLSAETFIDIYKNHSRMREIMETAFPIDSQPSDIEAELDKTMKEMVEIFKGMPDNPIGKILRAKTGIKQKQLSEFLISMGLKPDLRGVVIPLAINSNTMIRGVDRPSAHYIDAIGAHKSLIMNKKVINLKNLSPCTEMCS